MNSFWNNLRMFLWMTLLTGIIYPLLITAIGYVAMKPKAEGSIVRKDGKVIGSILISQKFESDKYFWPRPSAHDYNALQSGGSNYGPTSASLKKIVDKRNGAVIKASSGGDRVPAELLFASGSGLDPHISPGTALFQAERIAKVRHMDDSQAIEKLIRKRTKKRFLGFIGVPYVNVLELNIALDEMKAAG